MEGRPRRSRFILPFALATVAIILVVGVFEFSNPISSPGSTSGTSSASSVVSTAFNAHLNELLAMNISSMQNDYTPNATAEFYATGQGNYFSHELANKSSSTNSTGPHEIYALYQGTFLSDFIIPHITDDNYNVTVKGNVANVDSTFDLSGTNVDSTNLFATVIYHATYTETDGNWLISHELWNFTDIVSH